jgi:serine/threonine protein phosphatase PrpC
LFASVAEARARRQAEERLSRRLTAAVKRATQLSNIQAARASALMQWRAALRTPARRPLWLLGRAVSVAWSSVRQELLQRRLPVDVRRMTAGAALTDLQRQQAQTEADLEHARKREEAQDAEATDSALMAGFRSFEVRRAREVAQWGWTWPAKRWSPRVASGAVLVIAPDVAGAGWGLVSSFWSETVRTNLGIAGAVAAGALLGAGWLHRIVTEHRAYPTFLQTVVAMIPVVGPFLATYNWQLLHVKIRSHRAALGKLIARAAWKDRSRWARARLIVKKTIVNRATTAGPRSAWGDSEFAALLHDGGWWQLYSVSGATNLGHGTTLDTTPVERLSRFPSNEKRVVGGFLIVSGGLALTFMRVGPRMDFRILAFIVPGFHLVGVAKRPVIARSGFDRIHRRFGRRVHSWAVSLEGPLSWQPFKFVLQLQGVVGVGVGGPGGPGLGDYRQSVQTIRGFDVVNRSSKVLGRLVRRPMARFVTALPFVHAGDLAVLADWRSARAAVQRHNARMRLLRRFDDEVSRLWERNDQLDEWFATLAELREERAGLPSGPRADELDRKIAKLQKREKTVVAARRRVTAALRENNQLRRLVVEAEAGVPTGGRPAGAGAFALPATKARGVQVGNLTVGVVSRQGQAGVPNGDVWGVRGTGRPGEIVVAVADGVGGPDAAQAAVTAVNNAVVLPGSASEIAGDLYRRAEEATTPDPDAIDPPTASFLTVAVVPEGSGSRIAVFGVGDIRAVLVTADGRIRTLTDEMVYPTEGGMSALPDAVTEQTLGSVVLPYPGSVFTGVVNGPAVVVVMTDGAHDVVTPALIADVVAGANDTVDAVRQLIDVVPGGGNDATIVAVPVNTGARTGGSTVGRGGPGSTSSPRSAALFPLPLAAGAGYAVDVHGPAGGGDAMSLWEVLTGQGPAARALMIGAAAVGLWFSRDAVRAWVARGPPVLRKGVGRENAGHDDTGPGGADEARVREIEGDNPDAGHTAGSHAPDPCWQAAGRRAPARRL